MLEKQIGSTRRWTLGWAIAGVVSLGLLATGCSSSSTAVTKSTYDAQANAICNAVQSQVNSASGSAGNSDSAYVAKLDALVQSLKQVHTKLVALPQPSAESAALQKVYAQQQTLIDQLQSFAAADKAGTASAATIQSTGQSIQAANTALSGAFDGLGLTACGGSGSSGG
jgi:O-acetyl-ADP-ribose deacetylase (regulator of RNase III)